MFRRIIAIAKGISAVGSLGQEPLPQIYALTTLAVAIVLILLVCSAVAIGWVFGLKLNAIASVNSNLLLVAFIWSRYYWVNWVSLEQITA
ncbi:hypothetical protein BCD67_14630 [Oscillatoriales cyanobacterium USR001]|nr:hypothetical protein BCD67_14630 [Oscillatoriales cyanobacterium USR001]